MKYLIKFIFAFWFFLNFLLALGQYETETALNNCIVTNLKQEGIDYNAYMNNAHKNLVDEGVLDDLSGESIIKFIKKVQAENAIKLPNDQLYVLNFKSELIYLDITNICPSIDSLMKNDSACKMNKLSKAIQNLKEPSPRALAKLVLDILTPNDFEHPYYRDAFLTALNLSTYLKNDIEEKLSPGDIPDE